MTSPTILGFDTSGPWVGTAIWRGGDVIAAQYQDMARGQSERLMPLITETLGDAGIGLHDLTAIGVGVGPGNFTGIRISVATARGLSLGLRIPAIGVSLLDALALDAPRPTLACLTAPRGQLYLQRFGPGVARGPELVDAADARGWLCSGLTLVGQDSDQLADSLDLETVPAAYAPASAIARITAARLGTGQPRPSPLYIRPPDAAPARAVPPVV